MAVDDDNAARRRVWRRAAGNGIGRRGLVTPAGFRHPILRSVHPTNPHWDEDAAEGIQFSATEILNTLTRLRDEDAATRPVRYDLDWEADFDERIWETYGEVI